MVSHCDDDDLSLLALGESVDPDVEAHLSTCSRCQSRLDQLSAVVSSARSISPDDHPVAPAPHVWEGIAAELGLGVSQAGEADVVSLDEVRRSRRPRVWLVAASAAVIGAIIGGGLTTVLSSSPPSYQLVASTTLGPIEDSGFSGTATIEQAGAATSLTVDVPGLPAVPDGYYEVWMATPDTSTMVAIGTMRPGEPVTFALPPGLDPTAFPVVDVSVEHFDGEAAHSAVSVVRGTLDA